MSEPIDVAVVAVTYNSARLLPHFLSALPNGVDGLNWHLVVVDNASTDDSVQVAKNLAPDATVVATGRNGGYSAGINTGIAAAPPHSAVLILNPDVRLGAGCARELATALKQTGAGIAVPLLTDGEGRRIDSLRREPTVVRALADALIGARRAGRIGSLGEVITDERYYTEARTVDWAEGSTLLVSAECLRACGPWDESFFLYSEETEFALRAKRKGFVTRFTPDARAVHLKGDSRRSPDLWTLLVLNRVRLHRRRKGLAAGVALWAVLVGREGSRALLGRRTSRAAFGALLDPRLMTQWPSDHLVRSDGPAGVSTGHG